jgi:hypothetical protein
MQMQKYNMGVKDLSERFLNTPELIFNDIDSPAFDYACLNDFEKGYIKAIFADLRVCPSKMVESVYVKNTLDPEQKILQLIHSYDMNTCYGYDSDDEEYFARHGDEILDPVKKVITDNFPNWKKYKSHMIIQNFIKIKIGNGQKEAWENRGQHMHMLMMGVNDISEWNHSLLRNLDPYLIKDYFYKSYLPSYQVDIDEANFLDQLSI